MKWIEKICKKAMPVKNTFLTMIAFVLISSVSTLLLGFVVPKEVTLVDGDKEITVTTGRMFVEEVLAEQGITLRRGDRISKPLDATLQNNDRIAIERGKKIVLTADGKTEAVYSCEPVLKDALLDGGIMLGEHDEVEPGLETAVTEGMGVQIFRVEVFEETRSEKILKREVFQPNYEKRAGYTNVIEEGWDGAASVTYRVVKRDGVEVSREETERTVLWDACNKIVEKGIQGTKVVAASTADLPVKKVIQCTATAYDASPASNGVYAGQTATGRAPAYGVIAVDPRVIPLGSKLYIEAVDGSWTYGYAIAGDTGGAIKGNKIDLFYNTAGECRQFGRRQAKVYILE
ncbi:MAG: DUF348 domain-containing protein [Clostridia bacterium]|nr:DUF348 domain-containing protein [Clostridia bacterium]